MIVSLLEYSTINSRRIQRFRIENDKKYIGTQIHLEL